jgi:hypothetical protein
MNPVNHQMWPMYLDEQPFAHQLRRIINLSTGYIVCLAVCPQSYEPGLQPGYGFSQVCSLDAVRLFISLS